ncbi:MAG: hypothetical protein HY741_04250 [Chloroflexi bacterium]|nr:hypothetical protein [Chloroflexota bacterium]
MSRKFKSRRVTLTILLVLWLSVQPIVIGVSPAWGFVLPHGHITNGVMTNADWQAHAREHRLGSPSGVLYAARCDGTGVKDTSPILASLTAAQGLLAVLAFDATAQNRVLEIPAPGMRSARLMLHVFSVHEMFFSPLHPPPNV